MVESYCKLFELGFAECFGSYINGELVGGIYGVKFGNYFSAESMFYTKPNASKIALLNCIDSLKSEGLHWIDCQVINSVTASLGAKEIPRNQFTELLSKTILKRK